MTEKKYDNTNRGALFPNDKGDNPRRPDYTGHLNVEGEEYRISAWVMQARSGREFLSVRVEKSTGPGNQRKMDGMDAAKPANKEHE